MKLGTRKYNKQETVIIENYRTQIISLQSEIEDRWNALLKQISDGKKEHDDYLWDYVMNDFKP